RNRLLRAMIVVAFRAKQQISDVSCCLWAVAACAPRLYHCGFSGQRPVMSRGSPSIAALFACCGLAPLAAHAQYEVDEQNSVWLRALIDVRVARGPEFPSWTDSGPGKLRYGGRGPDA